MMYGAQFPFTFDLWLITNFNNVDLTMCVPLGTHITNDTIIIFGMTIVHLTEAIFISCIKNCTFYVFYFNYWCYYHKPFVFILHKSHMNVLCPIYKQDTAITDRGKFRFHHIWCNPELIAPDNVSLLTRSDVPS